MSLLCVPVACGALVRPASPRPGQAGLSFHLRETRPAGPSQLTLHCVCHCEWGSLPPPPDRCWENVMLPLSCGRQLQLLQVPTGQGPPTSSVPQPLFLLKDLLPSPTTTLSGPRAPGRESCLRPGPVWVRLEPEAGGNPGDVCSRHSMLFFFVFNN